MQASCCSLAMDFSAPRKVSLVMAAIKSVSEMITDTYGGISRPNTTGKQKNTQNSWIKSGVPRKNST
ncbi:hypothetical protein D9M69_647130 [compost metagenome]